MTRAKFIVRARPRVDGSSASVLGFVSIFLVACAGSVDGGDGAEGSAGGRGLDVENGNAGGTAGSRTSAPGGNGAGGGDSGGAVAGGAGTAALGGAAGMVSGGSDAGGMVGGNMAGAPPPLPEGKVGVFVAAGFGLRTVTSCDDGRSWIANDIVSNTNDDHSPFAHKGLAYGNGSFVTISGWGPGSSHMKISEDGVNWRQRGSLDDASIGYSDGTFVVVNAGARWRSDDGGVTWDKGPGPGGGRVRGADGNGPAMGLAGDGGAPLRITWNGGQSWRSVSGCPGGTSFGGIGQHGGFASGSDVLVAGSREGHICVVNREGRVVSTRSTGGDMGKPTPVGNEIWVPGEGAMWIVSADGMDIARKPIAPGGLAMKAIAYNPGTGAFVGVTTDGFYRSDDGAQWQKVNGPGGPRMYRVNFGVVSASVMCPGE